MSRFVDRLLRPVARRLISSERAASWHRPTYNRRGDRLDPHLKTMIRLSERVGTSDLDAGTVRQMRMEFERSCWLGASDPVAMATLDEVVEGLPVRWYLPEGRGDDTLVFLHGGGWTVGGLESYDVVCRRLADAAQRTVIAVDYPLAPEHPWPEPIHAVARVFRALHQRVREERIGRVDLGGDSAGGKLTLTANLVLRDEGGPLPDRQFLIYPGLDTECRCESHTEFADGFILTADSVQRYLSLYSPDAAHPLGCPFTAPDLSGLPPTVLTVAGFDVLRDEGLLFAERLDAAGVHVSVLDERSLCHGYLNYDGLVPEAAAAVDRLASALRHSSNPLE